MAQNLQQLQRCKFKILQVCLLLIFLCNQITIVAEGQNLKCHKVVLATHSKVISDIVTDSECSCDITITLDEVSVQSVQFILDYLYAYFTLNSNLGYQPQSKSARLGVSKCIGDLIEYGLVYKSAFSFFLALLF